MDVLLEQLKDIRTGAKADDECYTRDRYLYQQGRVGSTEVLTQSLSERDRGCYDMGYAMYQEEQQYVN